MYDFEIPSIPNVVTLDELREWMTLAAEAIPAELDCAAEVKIMLDECWQGDQPTPTDAEVAALNILAETTSDSTHWVIVTLVLLSWGRLYPMLEIRIREGRIGLSPRLQASAMLAGLDPETLLDNLTNGGPLL